MDDDNLMADIDIKDQVIAQCKAVEHMAHVLARLHSDKAVMFAQGMWPSILDLVGKETAYIMEQLGDMLNNMDAVTEEDARFYAVFERAQKLWPTDSERP